jgi:hypothetical protein
MTITLSVYKEARKPKCGGRFPARHPLHEEAHGTHYVCRVRIEGNDHWRISEVSGKAMPALAGRIEMDVAAGAKRLNALPSEVRFLFHHDGGRGTKMIYGPDESVLLEVDRAPLDVKERSGFIRYMQNLVDSLSPSQIPATLPFAAAIVLV